MVREALAGCWRARREWWILRGLGLPSGTVTFLFTDVEGSTRLLEELGDERYAAVLAEHHRVCREVWSAHGGVEVDTAGDAFFVAFARPSDALSAAAAAQEALASGRLRGRLRVRMGVHSGEVTLGETGYVGMEVHRAARIAAAGHGGQVLVSSQTANLVGRDGLRYLGEHSFKDLAAPESVFQLGECEFRPLKSLFRTNLPVPATLFIGRERELADLIEIVTREDVRLLTLTGPGGTGKTRLAIQAAAEAFASFPDGLWWVPLAPVRDPALVLAEIARALEVREEPERPLSETLVRRLEGKRAVLVLDNAEHLLPGIASDVGGLRDAGGLTVLVTSRERLQLAGEHVVAVPSLDRGDAVALFAGRAQELDSTFAITDTVGQLCERLDNLPLALELAAARTVVFSPVQLLERLGERLDLLKGGRDTDPRQQTLRATIEWSHELLTSGEQQLFRRLSVFVGGCTYEDAEQVCECDPDTLQALIDKSLVRRREAETAARYWMLETIREYAGERLDDSGEAEVIRRLHADRFCALIEEGDPQLRGRGQSTWLRRLETEHSNIRDALDVAHALPDPELELRLAGACWYFWYLRTHLREGTERLERAHARQSSQSPDLQAQVLEGLTCMAAMAGSLEQGFAFARESLALRRASGNAPGQLRSLLNHGITAAAMGDVRIARASLDECRELAQALGDQWFYAVATWNLAFAASADGNFPLAERLTEKAYEALQDVGDEMLTLGALVDLALTNLELGKTEAACSRLADALKDSLDTEFWAMTVASLDGLAAGAVLIAHDELAARLTGHGISIEERLDFTLFPSDQDRRERTLAAVGGRLGADRLASLLAEGAAMSLDDAVEHALSLDTGGSARMRTEQD